MRRNEIGITRHLFIFLVLIVLSGCFSNKTVKWDEYRAGLRCFTYEPQMWWKDIKETFGEADRYPIPTGESLEKNTRIYEDSVVIFHIDRKKISVDGKIRYEEVVKKVEICKER